MYRPKKTPPKANLSPFSRAPWLNFTRYHKIFKNFKSCLSAPPLVVIYKTKQNCCDHSKIIFFVTKIVSGFWYCNFLVVDFKRPCYCKLLQRSVKPKPHIALYRLYQKSSTFSQHKLKQQGKNPGNCHQHLRRQKSEERT